MPRTTPYTTRGIKRVPCARCGAKSHAQWNVCADKVDGRVMQYRGLCVECDIGLNEVAMRFVFGDTREQVIATYAKSARQVAAQG